MKTTKFFMIVALLSIATMTFSQKTNERIPFTVKITLKCAMQDPYLVRVMHEQIRPDFTSGDVASHVYAFAVKYRGVRYVITGTLKEWKKFFALELGDPTPEG
jgi:hypothetical protein